jgi:hypothetical protein
MGPIVLRQRAYYSCPACRHGHCPADAALGLGAQGLTPGAEQLVSLAGTVASFAEAAAKLLPKMAGLRLAESTVERTTEAAGQRLGAAPAVGRTFGAAADWPWPADARGRPTAYVSLDATGVGMQGPGGIEADGRMAYVGKVFAPRPEPGDAGAAGRRPAAIERSRYLAGFYALDELGAQLRRQAAQVGMDRAEQWVALTDGGSGLEDFMRVHFPRAVRILDFYHAADHLSDLAKALHGGATEAAEAQTEGWAHQMKHEGGVAILRTLEALDLRGRSEAVVEVYRQVVQYVRNHVPRMDYPRYRAEGWQIGSGHIEAACKAVVNERLKRVGMRWGDDGADAVGHLRALFKGEPGQWDAFWTSSLN